MSSAYNNFGHQLYINDYFPAIDNKIAVTILYPNDLSKATKMYRDGIEILTTSTGNRYVNAGTYVLGAGNTSAPALNTNGRIYTIRIYSRNLTDAEIEKNYAVDKERFNLS